MIVFVQPYLSLPFSTSRSDCCYVIMTWKLTESVWKYIFKTFTTKANTKGKETFKTIFVHYGDAMRYVKKHEKLW